MGERALTTNGASQQEGCRAGWALGSTSGRMDRDRGASRSQLAAEAHLCFEGTLLSLAISASDKVHFVKYDDQSMIRLLHGRGEGEALAQVNTGPESTACSSSLFPPKAGSRSSAAPPRTAEAMARVGMAGACKGRTQP